MRDLLGRGELDLAFLLGPLGDPTMANRELCAYSLAFIASPDLDIGEEPLSLARIRNFPIITYPKATAPYPRLREALNDPSLPPPRIFGNSSLTTIVRMTLDRIGLSVIPPIVVQKELSEGRLRIVQTSLTVPDLVFTAAFPLALMGGLAQPMAELAQEVARQFEAAPGA
jgi:DNA-binding transcriptional LysR family regulator